MLKILISHHPSRGLSKIISPSLPPSSKPSLRTPIHPFLRKPAYKPHNEYLNPKRARQVFLLDWLSLIEHLSSILSILYARFRRAMATFAQISRTASERCCKKSSPERGKPEWSKTQTPNRSNKQYRKLLTIAPNMETTIDKPRRI